MAAYLKVAREHLKSSKLFKIEQVPRIENAKANNLARLASGLEDDTLGQTPIETLSEPSISEPADHAMLMDYSSSWVDPISEYLTNGKTPKDKNETRRLKYQANRYTVLNRKLYRRGYATSYLRCL